MKPIILCVDDEKIVLDSLKSQLKREFNDFELEIAESGEEALEIIEEFIEDGYTLPLVISDQIMPGLKGDELLVKVNELLPNTLKILLTGQASADAVGNALNKAKLYRYISKPWDEYDLILTVKEATKSYFQHQTVLEQKEQLEKLVQELKEVNESLEEKVEERTKEVVAQKEVIEKKNQAILSSLNYAKRIQQSMLPEEKMLSENAEDYFILFKPRDIVSGDFYWFEKTGGKFIIIAADCTGHGVPGAIMSMIGLEQLTEIVNLNGIDSPEQMLEELHLGVRRILKQDRTQSRDGMDMSVCTYEPERKTLSFAGAKNPIVYIQNGEMNYIKGDVHPIGGLQKEEIRQFKKHEIKIDAPTHVYIFSDGYQDQFGGADNRKFMIKRFRELLLEIHQEPFLKQREILDTTFETWRREGGQNQIDDVLVIGFKIG